MLRKHEHENRTVVIESAKYFLNFAWGSWITPSRIPTFCRKLLNEETFLQRNGSDNSITNTFGVFGTLLGLVPQAYTLNYVINEANNDEPIYLIVASGLYALGNAISGTYEIIKNRRDLENVVEPVMGAEIV
ncbi:hypothetical protein K8R47_02315 [archaeon]|nr:hypothetical protein [archaeon]